MPGRMRTLRLFLYCTALTGLLFGVTEAIALALGGATADALMAQGFVLVALASGLRYQGAGHVPLRASFLLLGLAGLMPALAGFAPLGAAFSAFLFLPLRAAGARLSAALGSVPAGGSMLVLGGFCSWLLLTANAPGLPGFLFLWVIAGILQRYVVPAPAEEKQSPAPAWTEILPTLLIGAGLGLSILHLSSYASLFDAGGALQDWSRGFALGLVFFAIWFTFGSGFAETRLRVGTASLTALLGGLTIGLFGRYAAFLASPEALYYWIKHPDLRERFFPQEAALPEEHALFVPLLTVALFAIPAGLTALLGRNLLRRDGLGIGPMSLAPLAGGFGIAFLGTSLLPASLRMTAVPLLAAIFLCAGGLAVTRLRFLQIPGIALSVVVVLVILPTPERPPIRHSLVDSAVWQNVGPTDDQVWEGGAALQQEDLFSLTRLLSREAIDPADGVGRPLLFDNRNRLSARKASFDRRRAEALLVYGLAAQPEDLCWVGVPQPEVVHSLLRHGARKLTFASDPAGVARMALSEFTLDPSPPVRAGTQLEFQRSLAHCDGPYGMILFDGQAMWESRHNLFRAELLRQASLRLKADGTCAFLLSPEQVMPGMLAQWHAEFQSVFPQTTMLLLPDGLEQVRIAFLGRKGDADAAWPIPPASMQTDLAGFGLPVTDADDLASLTLRLRPDAGGHHWLFRGPFRPAHAALAPTIDHTIDRNRKVERAAEVLTDLLPQEAEDGNSLLAFYAAQFGAQEFSVHDTYIDNNPYAIESSAEALDHLMRTTLAFPDSQMLQRTWAEIGVNLVESREIQWLDTYYGRLFHELGWETPEIRLGLAHAAMEMLDFEMALEHLDAILAQYPNFLPAKELKRLAEAEEQVPRDEHAGHNH